MPNIGKDCLFEGLPARTSKKIIPLGCTIRRKDRKADHSKSTAIMLNLLIFTV
jgi:hypothetical protein